MDDEASSAMIANRHNVIVTPEGCLTGPSGVTIANKKSELVRLEACLIGLPKILNFHFKLNLILEPYL